MMPTIRAIENGAIDSPPRTTSANQYQQGRDTRDNRARQHLVDRRYSLTSSADNTAQREKVLANSVESDDGIVERVADYGEHRRDDREVERQLEQCEKNPTVTMTSWTSAATAPAENFHWKRIMTYTKISQQRDHHR